MVMSMLRLRFLPSLLYMTADFGGGKASSGANVWAAIDLLAEMKGGSRVAGSADRVGPASVCVLARVRLLGSLSSVSYEPHECCWLE